MKPVKQISFTLIYVILLLGLFLKACSNNSPTGPGASDFDRQTMLVNWADNIIIPAYTDFSDYTSQLHLAAEAFSDDPDQETFQTLRESWESAYLVFQRVSLFNTGPAKSIMLRDFLNTYPANTKPTDTDPPNSVNITSNIESGSYNLELPALRSSQGFPALDYLLYGLAESDAGILEFYTTGNYASNYRLYLTDLTNRVNTLTEEVLSEWNNGYRDQFIDNSGDGVNASVDLVVNDYNIYYEGFLRRGKVGLPAGVFSATTLSHLTEAFYRGDLSKSLLLEALSTVQNFFNGKYYDSSQTGESLKTYLDYLNTMKQGADLSSVINSQFESAREAILPLNDNFTEQIDSDITPMLMAYDELQKNVVFLKTDMPQALGVSITYFDNDGD